MEDKIVIVHILKELEELAKGNEFNLASRLLLDLLTDYEFSPQLLKEAIDFRVKVNQLESQEILLQSQNELKAAFEQLILTIKVKADIPIQPADSEKQENYTQFLDQYQSSSKLTKNKQIAFEGIGIGKNYKNMSFQLSGINLQLLCGELTGVVGENGHGKTTLLRIVAGNLSHTSGSLRYSFTDNAQDWYDIKQQIAFIPQRLPKWSGLLKDNLHFAAANHGIFGKENEAIVEFIIHRLGLTKYINATWKDISTGYKLRFELAKALVWRPKLLVLDEPLANLDINTKLLFMQDLRLLTNIQKHPISIILSSQQLHEIEGVVDNIIFLRAGKSIYNGSIKDLGKDREQNSFEVSGDFDRSQLLEVLKAFENITVEDTGQSLIINTPKSIENSDLLSTLASKLKIKYFRDISQSTRKFFNS